MRYRRDEKQTTTGTIVSFPLTGTPIHQWYSKALAVKNQVNMASAQLWIQNNVPKQFHKMINKNVRLSK